MKVLTRTTVTIAALLLWNQAYAVTDVFDLESTILTIVQKLAGALVALALALFFWGLVKFIKNASDTKAHEEGKQFILWGLVSFLVIFSLWAIVGLILGDIGISTSSIGYIYAS